MEILGARAAVCVDVLWFWMRIWSHSRGCSNICLIVNPTGVCIAIKFGYLVVHRTWSHHSQQLKVKFTKSSLTAHAAADLVI